MKTLQLNAILVGLILYVSCLVNVANAGLITIGNLTLENAGDNYVTDTVNRVDYMRWDVVNTLNYSQLISRLQVGGMYDGWTIAENVEANNFVNALLPTSSLCDVTTNTNYCGSDASLLNFPTLMGASYNGAGLFNYAWFINSTTGNEVGYIEVLNGSYVYKYNSWNSITESDKYSALGAYPQYPIGFMLYRSSVSVPEPSTLAIFALGIFGLASRRFKKQS